MKYTIIHVNDRCKDIMDYNKSILKDFEYIDSIDFFDGNKGNAWDVLNHKGIKQNVWKPYDGRNFDPLPGELGIWVSTMNIWNYIVENKIEEMLVLEDDIKLQNNFINNFNLCLNDLPSNFDIFSLYYFIDQNNSSDDVEAGSEYIQKANNQYSAGQGILYTYSGAKKLLKLFKRLGLEYTTDCFIFNKCQQNLLNGYTLKKENNFLLTHENKKIRSLIDPENIRNTDDTI